MTETSRAWRGVAGAGVIMAIELVAAQEAMRD